MDPRDLAGIESREKEYIYIWEKRDPHDFLCLLMLVFLCSFFCELLSSLTEKSCSNKNATNSSDAMSKIRIVFELTF